jgi:hypothetical protein
VNIGYLMRCCFQELTRGRAHNCCTGIQAGKISHSSLLYILSTLLDSDRSTERPDTFLRRKWTVLLVFISQASLRGYIKCRKQTDEPSVEPNGAPCLRKPAKQTTIVISTFQRYYPNTVCYLAIPVNDHQIMKIFMFTKATG